MEVMNMIKHDNKGKYTALYERLSKDDERMGESLSIENQKLMLEDYARRNGFDNVRHFTDDGITGTIFNRPGLNALVEEVKAGRVSTVIIKDQSRIGRDVIEVGLLKRTFDEYNVRFIAAEDNLDTANGFDIMSIFRDVINEFYVADTSRKIKAVFKARMQDGKRVSPSVPYGYLRDPNDKQKLIIDPEPAEVVKRIYQLVMEGKGVKAIADILSADNVLIPAAYAEKHCPENQHSKNFHSPIRWSATTVSYILDKREYMGDTILGKTISENYKTKKRRKATTDELMVFEGTHPAIIEPEQWHNVQRLRQSKKRPRKNNTPSCHLSGLLWCSDCNKKLTLRYHPPKEGKNKTEILAYICSSYRALHTDCTMHYVNVKVVEDLVLTAIRRTCAYVRDFENDFVERIIQKSKAKQTETVRERKRQLNKSNSRIAELDGLVKTLYESFASGSIPEKYFKKLVSGYDEEQAKLEQDITELQTELDGFISENINVDKFIKLVKKHTDFAELTTPLLNEFVERVVVHEGIGKGKERVQKIEIHFNFIGEFITPADFITPYEIEEERRQAEEQAEKAKRKQKSLKITSEKSRQKQRDFTARKKAGLLTPDEIEFDKKRRAKINEHNRAEYAKRKAAEPPKPPKPLSRNAILKRHYAGLPLTDEEFAVYRTWQDKKTEQARARRHRIKAEQPPKPPREKKPTKKEIISAIVVKVKADITLTPEEQEIYQAYRVESNTKHKVWRDKEVDENTQKPTLQNAINRKRAGFELTAEESELYNAWRDRQNGLRRENYHQRKAETA